jgi:hypothetical protein
MPSGPPIWISLSINGNFIARGRNGDFKPDNLTVVYLPSGTNGRSEPYASFAIRSRNVGKRSPLSFDGPAEAMAQLLETALTELRRAINLPANGPESPIDSDPRTRVISTTPEGD